MPKEQQVNAKARRVRRSRSWGRTAVLILAPLACAGVWVGLGADLLSQAREERRGEQREALEALQALLRRARHEGRTFVQNRNATRQAVRKQLDTAARLLVGESERILSRALRLSRAREVAWQAQALNTQEDFTWLDDYDVIDDSRLSRAPDWAGAVLEASRDTIKPLLPAGAVLTVSEPAGGLAFRLAGKDVSERGMQATAAREIVFQDGGRNRKWSLGVCLVDPAVPPAVTAQAYAAHLSRTISRGVSSWVEFRGLVLTKQEEVLDSWPAAAPSLDALPLPKKSRWTPVEGGSHVTRIESLPPVEPCPWGIAAQIVLADRPDADRAWALAEADWRLGALALFSLLVAAGMMGWALFGGRRPVASADLEGAAPVRFVRKQDAPPLSAQQGVTLAEVGAASDVRLVGSEKRPACRKTRGGSLKRLQAMHRSGDGQPGARILDGARSPLLKELVKRVRPQADETGGDRMQEGRPASKRLSLRELQRRGKAGASRS